MISGQGKGMYLECVILPDLSPLFVGDEARIRQILFNLVGNACKYTGYGSVMLHLDPEITGGATGAVFSDFQESKAGYAADEKAPVHRRGP